jgi:formylglycine-generating enzyme required for sulfatase activity
MPATIPQELVTAIARGDAVLFVGAGLSAGAGLPGWSALLAPLADEIELPAEKRGDLLRVAQYCQNELGRQRVIEAILNATDTTGKPVTENHRRLVRLGCATWITTNYDDLLERTLREAGISPRTVVEDNTLSFTTGETVTLLKPHGDRGQSESIIVTKADYDTLALQRPLMQSKLKTLLAEKTFLFLGYSLRDPDFGLVLAEVGQYLGQFQRNAYAVLFDADRFTIADLQRQHIKALTLATNGEPIHSRLLGEWLDELIRQVQAQVPARTAPTAAVSGPGARQALEDYLTRAVARYETRQTRALVSRELPKEPYRGLLPFELEDRTIFFGRVAAIAGLLEAVLRDRLTVVQARSGAGKTSLLNAGLAPRLIEAGRLPVYARPYEDPVLALKRALASPGQEPWPAGLLELPLPEFLGLVCGRLSRETREPVLVLDQFEEFFVFWPLPEQRRAFIEALAECYHDRALPVRIILSIRKDYFGDLQELQPRLPVFQNVYRVEPMTRGETEAAITGPVRVLGRPVSYEPALVDTLLDDLARGGMELPHLQIICSKLYDVLPAGGATITLESYRGQGGAQGILGRHLQDVLEQFPGDGAGVARRMLKALISSEGTRSVQSAVGLASATGTDAAGVAPILEALVRARILQCEETGGEVRYQLAHEYLIREIGAWFDPTELAARQAQELLQRQLISWRQRPTLLIPEAALRMIHEQRDALPALRDEEAELLLRSALAADFDVPYWRARVPAVVGKVEAELFGGLGAEDPSQAEQAVQGLGRLASPDIVGRLAALVDDEFGKEGRVWVDHMGQEHRLRRTVLNLRTPTQRRAVLTLAKLTLPEATAALARWTPPGMVLVPAGSFTLGSNEYSDEGPVHEVWLDAFWLDLYSVTNAQWAAFLARKPWQQRELWTEAGWDWRKDKKPEPDQWSRLRKKLDHPVRYICWYEALAYARWTGKTLLSEAQWEKAARGTDGRRYPWGDDFDLEKCNTDESKIGDTTPVGRYSPGGASPYGVADMAGDVLEWCRNLFVPYKYNATDGRETLEGTGFRVLRGGSFVNQAGAARCDSCRRGRYWIASARCAGWMRSLPPGPRSCAPASGCGDTPAR